MRPWLRREGVKPRPLTSLRREQSDMNTGDAPECRSTCLQLLRQLNGMLTWMPVVAATRVQPKDP